LTSVYFSKCGTENSDDASCCKKFGAPLQATLMQDWGSHRHRHHDHSLLGSGIGALVIGIIIIVAGLGILFPELP